MENKIRLGPIKEIIIFGGSRPRMFGISQSPNSFCVSSFKRASILLHSHLGQHPGKGALDKLVMDWERCKFPCPACRPKMNLCPQSRQLNSNALYFLENFSKSVPKHTYVLCSSYSCWHFSEFLATSTGLHFATPCTFGSLVPPRPPCHKVFRTSQRKQTGC